MNKTQRPYRGKYPNRVKMVSYSRTDGWHVTLNSGVTFRPDSRAVVLAFPVRGIECGMDWRQCCIAMQTALAADYHEREYAAHGERKATVQEMEAIRSDPCAFLDRGEADVIAALIDIRGIDWSYVNVREPYRRIDGGMDWFPYTAIAEFFAAMRVERTRRNNVEYHNGRKACEAGEPITANPYPDKHPAGDSRFERWALGWTESAASAPVAPVEAPREDMAEIEAGREMARHMVDYRDAMRIGQDYQRKCGYIVTRAFWLEECRIARAILASANLGWPIDPDTNARLERARSQLEALRATRLATEIGRYIASGLDRAALARIVSWCEAGAGNLKARGAEIAAEKSPGYVARAMTAMNDADTFKHAAHYLRMIAEFAK